MIYNIVAPQAFINNWVINLSDGRESLCERWEYPHMDAALEKAREYERQGHRIGFFSHYNAQGEKLRFSANHPPYKK